VSAAGRVTNARQKTLPDPDGWRMLSIMKSTALSDNAPCAVLPAVVSATKCAVRAFLFVTALLLALFAPACASCNLDDDGSWFLRTLPGAVSIKQHCGINDEMIPINRCSVALPDEPLFAVYAPPAGVEAIDLSWQWRMNGILLEGATESSHIPTEEGNYTVSVRVQGYRELSSAAAPVSDDPNAAAHEWGGVLESMAPTCIAAGSEKRKCALCAREETFDISADPNAHSWGGWQVNEIPPTETEDNKDARACDDCSSEETRPASGGIEYATGTAGLAFELIGVWVGGTFVDNVAYSVRCGNVTSGVVHIPRYHRPNTSSPYLPVTEVGSWDDDEPDTAFGNTGIAEVIFLSPSNITTIGAYAFLGCTGLTSVTIPDSVTTIGASAFWGCTGLTNVTMLAAMPPTLGWDVFDGTHASLQIFVPSGSVAAYQSAANWNTYSNRIWEIP
jgi:hypothetical protein